MSLRARLLIALGYLVALVLVAFGVPLAINLSDRVEDEVRSQARNQADVLAAGAGPLVRSRDEERLADVATTVGAAARARVVITGRRGAILADSADPGNVGADYSRRPEIAAALDGRRTQASRHSETLDTEILATAAPVFEARRVVGAVRLTQSIDAVDDATQRTLAGIAAVGLTVLLLALGVAFLLARGITRPIERLGAAADRIASGDLDARAEESGSREQRSLAHSFNVMTERLARLLRAQTEFVADASHQLRTPLTGVRLRMEEAQAITDEPEARAHLDAGLKELDRMSHTIDDLLVLSRTGERELPGEAVDLADAVGRRMPALGGRRERRRDRPLDRHRRGGRRLGRPSRPRPRARRAGGERDRLHAARRPRRAARGRGARRGARRRPRPGARRGDGGVRALPPRPRRPVGRRARHRPRAPDRARARAPLGRRRRPVVAPGGRHARDAVLYRAFARRSLASRTRCENG